MVFYLMLILLNPLMAFSSDANYSKKYVASYNRHSEQKYNNNFSKPIRKKIDYEEVTGSSRSRQEREVKKTQSENKDQIQFKHDRHTDVRGEPKMLKIYCDQCDTYVMDYQKDGPGRLLRCYLDRIHKPDNLKARQYERFSVKDSPNLKCSDCKINIGYPMIYKGYGENRPAYDMVKTRFYFKELKK